MFFYLGFYTLNPPRHKNALFIETTQDREHFILRFKRLRLKITKLGFKRIKALVVFK